MDFSPTKNSQLAACETLKRYRRRHLSHSPDSTRPRKISYSQPQKLFFGPLSDERRRHVEKKGRPGHDEVKWSAFEAMVSKYIYEYAH
ncbi:hypothetical protein TNCV_2980221 [Trichonephila clavipes]|nr:hypothetical protein TNCV_2980221 [Trichonephila clavipes]